MGHERCQRCFGEVLNGRCSCGFHTTVVTTPLGDKLREARKKIEEAGMCNLSPEDVDREVQERRGGLEEAYEEVNKDPGHLEVTKEWDSTCGDGIEKQRCSICDGSIKDIKRGEQYPVCDYHYFNPESSKEQMKALDELTSQAQELDLGY